MSVRGRSCRAIDRPRTPATRIMRCVPQLPFPFSKPDSHCWDTPARRATSAWVRFRARRRSRNTRDTCGAVRRSAASASTDRGRSGGRVRDGGKVRISRPSAIPDNGLARTQYHEYANLPWLQAGPPHDSGRSAIDTNRALTRITWAVRAAQPARTKPSVAGMGTSTGMTAPTTQANWKRVSE